MLRILVISLFVANLLLLGFQDKKTAVPPKTTARQNVVEDSGIPRIHLFSEMMQDQDLLTGNRQCFSLGPFHADQDMDEIREQLREVSASISERQTEALVEKGYWVFMPPYISLLEANQELFSLQALGLTDIGVIYDGDWKNAISLGYFLRQENAVKRKIALEDRGYAPSIRVQRQAEPRYWLDYEQTTGSGLIALDMRNRPNDFMQRSLPCPEQDLFDATQAESQELAGDTAQVQTPEENTVSQPGQERGMDAEAKLESMPEKNTEAAPDPGNELDSEIADETEASKG
jgi:hypothetical protein